MTEKQFENKVKQFLKDKGIVEAGTSIQDRPEKLNGWFFKVFGGGFQRGGIPDMVLNVNGKFIGLELKASNGVPSALQELNINLINNSNGIGIILYPDEFDNFKEIIIKLID